MEVLNGHNAAPLLLGGASFLHWCGFYSRKYIHKPLVQFVPDFALSLYIRPGLPPQSPFFQRNLRKFAIGIVAIKLRCQAVNSRIKFHFSPSVTKNAGRVSPFPPDNFFRPVFILPSCQCRHTTSSLGQFLFYRRVRTVTRLLRSYPFHYYYTPI